MGKLLVLLVGREKKRIQSVSKRIHKSHDSRYVLLSGYLMQYFCYSIDSNSQAFQVHLEQVDNVAEEQVSVRQPVVVIYGETGCGKTSDESYIL